MKHTTWVALFWSLGLVPAQTPTPAVVEPKVELAQVLAVEDQERDLAKAEAMYREALAGTALSVGARRLANQRLGALLVRLGRQAEGEPFVAAGKVGEVAGDGEVVKAQDPAREAEVRVKARELLKQLEGWNGGNLDGQDGFRGVVWLGEAAVPEVVAWHEVQRPAGNHNQRVAGFALLWRIGGTQAAAALKEASQGSESKTVANTAHYSCRSPEMIALVEDMLHMGGELTWPLLSGAASWLPVDRVVEILATSDARQQELLLRWLHGEIGASRRNPTNKKLVFAVVRAAVEGTDAALGLAANQLLGGDLLANDPDVAEWLLNSWAAGRFQVPPTNWQGMTVPPGRAATWLPKIDACVARLGQWQQGNKQVWLSSLIVEVCKQLDAAAVPLMLRWLDQGYPIGDALRGKVTKENAAAVFARVDKVGIEVLYGVDLPTNLFPALRERANEHPEQWEELGGLMVQTGNPEAAPWIAAAATRSGKPQQEGPGILRRAAQSLVALARRTREEPVRAAMRALVAEKDLGQLELTQLVFALLSMHDDKGLDLVREHAMRFQMNVKHPLGDDGSFQGHPLAWLMLKEPKPAHAYSEDEVARLLDQLHGEDILRKVLSPQDVLLGSLRDAHLMKLAELVPGTVTSLRSVRQTTESWPSHVVQIVGSQGGRGPLANKLRAVLQRPNPPEQFLTALNETTLVAMEDVVRPLLNNSDEGVACSALRKLLEFGRKVDLLEATRSPHACVRSVAIDSLARSAEGVPTADLLRLLGDPEGFIRRSAIDYAGERLLVEAVPALVAALRDRDGGNQKAATTALQRIRFYHDEQAHWDRVAKGLDASPTAAVEKLLLQAKPGAPRDQRLLAITSLGTLGIPESLPFLIEWTNDTDAAIQQAARTAITEIHLKPRR